MDAATAPRNDTNSPWRNPWVIGWLGLIVVVLLANVTMVVLAVVTNPGLVVEDYYERGRNYAETRAAQRLARPENWQVRLELPDDVFLGVPASFRVAATDERGLPVQADLARLFAYRPSDAAADFDVAMETEAPGVVATEVTFTLPGTWDLIVQLTAGDRVYDQARRISVRRP